MGISKMSLSAASKVSALAYKKANTLGVVSQFVSSLVAVDLCRVCRRF
jgi:hypothetical protein